MPITTCVFDAYGTLFDVTAAARRAAAEPGARILASQWPALAANWRAKQLQYTWLRAITGAHTDFRQVTQDGLDWAMEAAGLWPDPDLRARLMELYRALPAYGDVPAVLSALKDRGKRVAILSNGSPEMLSDAVASAGVGGNLDAVLSVEDVGVYKPDPRVYDLVETRFGVPPAEVLFVSSNGWDVAGAAKHGFKTVWVNRAGDPPDRLPWRPERTLPDLRAIPDLVEMA